MTESEWLTGRDPLKMLAHLTGDDREYADGSFDGRLDCVTDRKLRLFCCACYRSWTRTGSWVVQNADALRLGEQYADGLLSEEDRRDAYERIDKRYVGAWLIQPDAQDAAVACADHFAEEQSRFEVSALLRDIFGNPFRSVKLPGDGMVECPECGGAGEVSGDYFAEDGMMPCERCDGKGEVRGPGCPWVSDSAWAIAKDVYGNGRWDLTPVLADALEDAGCPVDVEQVCDECKDFSHISIGVCVSGYGKWINCPVCGGGKVVRKPNPLLEHLRLGPDATHSERCGTQFRGCAPECPKDYWERNGPHVRGCWAVDAVLWGE